MGGTLRARQSPRACKPVVPRSLFF